MGLRDRREQPNGIQGNRVLGPIGTLSRPGQIRDDVGEPNTGFERANLVVHDEPGSLSPLQIHERRPPHGRTLTG